MAYVVGQRLELEHLREPRLLLHVDPGQQPRSAALGGQLLQHRGELVALRVAGGAEEDHTPVW